MHSGKEAVSEKLSFSMWRQGDTQQARPKSCSIDKLQTRLNMPSSPSLQILCIHILELILKHILNSKWTIASTREEGEETVLDCWC